MTVAFLVTVFQPQTSSTPTVRKRLIDYLSSRTVVNKSSADDKCFPHGDTCPPLNISTPKQQTSSVTDIHTQATGTEPLHTNKLVENALPALSNPKPLCSPKHLQAPLTREEGI